MPKKARTFGCLAVFVQACLLGAAACLVLRLLWLRAVTAPGEKGPRESLDRLEDGEISLTAKSDLPPVTRLDDPGRVRRVRKAGHVYATHVKGGLVGSVFGVDRHGIRRPTRLAYAFETSVDQTVLSNDGRRVVVVCDFKRLWAVTLVADSTDLALQLGPPDEDLLGALPENPCHVGVRRAAVGPVAEAIVPQTASAVASDPTARACWEVQPLSGKRVRLEYVDGVGVTSIQPLGCGLSRGEQKLLVSASVLHDAFLLPAETLRVGETWSVDGRHLASIIPCACARVLDCEIELETVAVERGPGGPVATARIRDAGSPGPSSRDFALEGVFESELAEGIVTTARLAWLTDTAYRWLIVLRHSLPPQVELGGRPRVAVRYRCRVRPAASTETNAACLGKSLR